MRCSRHRHAGGDLRPHLAARLTRPRNVGMHIHATRHDDKTAGVDTCDLESPRLAALQIGRIHRRSIIWPLMPSGWSTLPPAILSKLMQTISNDSPRQPRRTQPPACPERLKPSSLYTSSGGFRSLERRRSVSLSRRKWQIARFSALKGPFTMPRRTPALNGPFRPIGDDMFRSSAFGLS